MSFDAFEEEDWSLDNDTDRGPGFGWISPAQSSSMKLQVITLDTDNKIKQYKVNVALFCARVLGYTHLR